MKKSGEKVFSLTYRYETDEYKIFKLENGRKYKVFKNGRVYSCNFDLVDRVGRYRHYEEKECLPTLTNNGDYELNLGGRKGKTLLLHTLVALCWLDNPEKLTTVSHINFNKGDNCIENLRWISQEEHTEKYLGNLKVKHKRIKEKA